MPYHANFLETPPAIIFHCETYQPEKSIWVGYSAPDQEKIARAYFEEISHIANTTLADLKQKYPALF